MAGCALRSSGFRTNLNWALFVLAVLPWSLRAGDAPSPVQRQASIFGLVMEQATFADAQRVLGPAEVRHNRGDAAGSAYFACYVGPDGTTLVLAAGVEQGAGAITEFQLLETRALARFVAHRYTTPPDAVPRCASTRLLEKHAATGGGLRLGMSWRDVVRLLRPNDERPSEPDRTFVLEDRERPVRDANGSLIGHPSAWVTVTLRAGRVVAIRATYSSML